MAHPVGARPAAKPPGRRDRSSPGRRDRSYHHGDLHQALIAATEAILVERGVDGFTLREAARRVGVTPAAPAHHFGSAAGLLTEVALLGFQALHDHLIDAAKAAGASPAEQARALGHGYVRFARAHPARFQLMFRMNRLLEDDPRLVAACGAAESELERATRAYRGLDADTPLDAQMKAEMLGGWSLVHGFAHLALEGRFDDAAGDADIETFLRDTLDAILRRHFP